MADPRLTPARPDLAAKYLEGKVKAARFVDRRSVRDRRGASRRCAGRRAPTRAADPGAEGRARHGLRPQRRRLGLGPVDTRRLCRLACRMRRWQSRGRADPQGHRTAHLCLPRSLDQTAAGRYAGDGSHACRGARGRRVRGDARGCYLPRRHLGAARSHDNDFVAVAERFVGTPYLWGGKSSLGIDCSGLVQIADRRGTACPRDSDMQQDARQCYRSGPNEKAASAAT